MGWPARVYGPGAFGHSLRLRYHRLHITCARALGCTGFFAYTGDCDLYHFQTKLWIAFRLPIMDCFQIGPHCQCGQHLWLPFKFQLFLDRFQDSNWLSLTMWTTLLAAFQVSAFSSWQLLHGNFRIAYPQLDPLVLSLMSWDFP